MSKVTLVVLGLAMVGLTIGSVVAANTDGSCKFKENGNYVSDNGSISAFGPMNAAMDCATRGVLPASVLARLGKWGDPETKAWAEDIKRLNQEVIDRNKKAEEAPEPITPIEVESIDAPDV
tara:strand:+ start:526 stop:888 length:363 start_codon:yes stop_codon:yes gene_type:complete